MSCVASFNILGTECKVVEAGLCGDFYAGLTCSAEDGETFDGRQVDDMEWQVGS